MSSPIDSSRRVHASLRRLADKGYDEEFRAERGGLRAVRAGTLLPPDDLIVDHVARVEDQSDPDNQCILFGLRSRRTGINGTYCVPFGSAMGLDDARIVDQLSHELRRRRRRRTSGSWNH